MSLLANDYDPDDDEIAVVGVNGGSGNVGVSVSLPSGAAVTVQADGNFTYVPPTTFAGLDSFTYTISDGLAQATATVYVNVTNAAPVANDDNHQTPQNVVLYGNLLLGDTDDDGDTLTVVKINGSTVNVGVLVTLASGSTVIVHVDGTFTYTPADDFVGEDTFTYTITDGIAEATGNVIIFVLAD
jgi:hypothetical protein